jgi:hypothetical protein
VVGVGNSHVEDDPLMRLTCCFAPVGFVAGSAEEQCFFVRALNGCVAHFDPDCVAGKRQSVQHLPSHLVWLCSVGIDVLAAVEGNLEWGSLTKSTKRSTSAKR